MLKNICIKYKFFKTSIFFSLLCLLLSLLFSLFHCIQCIQWENIWFGVGCIGDFSRLQFSIVLYMRSRLFWMQFSHIFFRSFPSFSFQLNQSIFLDCRTTPVVVVVIVFRCPHWCYRTLVVLLTRFTIFSFFVAVVVDRKNVEILWQMVPHVVGKSMS